MGMAEDNARDTAELRKLRGAKQAVNSVLVDPEIQLNVPLGDCLIQANALLGKRAEGIEGRWN